MALMNISAQFHLGHSSGARRVEPESPMRILILADWLGDTPAPGPVAERPPVAIDIDRFQQVMARLTPGLALDGHDNLVFADIDDFHPDRLCRNLFQLKNLLLLYEGLDDPARIRELMAEVDKSDDQSGNDASGSTRTSDLERLLGGRPPEQDLDNAAERQIQKLMKEVVSPHLIDTKSVEPHRKAITTRLSEQLDAVLHEPRFQSLEANWRGLWWLVSQLVSEEIEIALLPITRQEFMEDLQAAGTQLDHSALHRHLLGGPDQPPWSVVVGLYEFGSKVDDIMALSAAALIAEAAGAPFIASARPDLAGCGELLDLADPARWQSGPEGESLELWRTLRQSSSGHWIGLTLPRFLTRLPYRPETDPIESFEFSESVIDVRSLPLASGALAVAAALGINFENHGQAMDPSLPVALEDLPGFSVSDEGQARFQSAVEMVLPDRALSALVQRGLTPLVGAPHRTDVHIPACVAVSGQTLSGRWSR